MTQKDKLLVLGVKKLSYTSKKTQKEVKGVVVITAIPQETSNNKGYKIQEFYIPNIDLFDQFVDLPNYYNIDLEVSGRYSKIVNIDFPALD